MSSAFKKNGRSHGSEVVNHIRLVLPQGIIVFDVSGILDNLVAQYRVGLHPIELLIRKPCGFVQDLKIDEDFLHIVQEAVYAEVLRPLLIKLDENPT